MVEFGGKHAFWQALVFTIIVFTIGIFIGYWIENSRGDDMELTLMNSEVNLLDEQVRIKSMQDFSVSCEVSKDSMFNFADRIYQEALLMEQYDYSSKFTKTLKVLHRRYDLLRMMLWSESISLKKKCSDFHTIVYLYEYDSLSIETKAQQITFSHLTGDLKNKYPDKVLLIPMAANTNLDSIDIARRNYNVTSLPVIIVDEKVVFDKVLTLEELEKVVFESNFSS